MDNISTQLLWELLALGTNFISKLELPDKVNEYSSNSVYIPVKKDKDEEMTSIIEDLKEIVFVCKNTKPTRTKNETVYSLIDKCEEAIKILSKKYPRKTMFGNKNDLQKEDRIELLEGFGNDLNNLGEMLVENTDIILNLEPKQNLDVNKKSLKVLDKSARLDLEEGLTLLQLGHTTASYMILMRVAESFVIKYHQKITNKIPPTNERAWGTLLENLKPIQVSKDDFNFKNILWFLKDRRNEAQHPGKRFTEKDCKKLLVFLTECVDYFSEYESKKNLGTK